MAHVNRRCAGVAALALLASVCVMASTAHADEFRPVVPAPENRSPDPLLVTTGAAVFGLPYLTSVGAAAESNLSADHWLYIPVVGPFADLIDRAACQTTGCKGDIGSVPLPLILDGLMQGAGVYILARSLLSPGTPVPPAKGADIHIAPTTYAGGGGLKAFGTF